MGLDPREYDMPALISQRLKTTKQHAEVPDASDAVATMKYWDNYRAKERARIAGLRLQTDDEGMLSPDELARVGVTIGEMPTVRTLWEREVTNHLEDIYRNGATPDMVLLTPELALEHGVIGKGRYRWLKLKQRIRGILKPKGSSGAQSARPTRGTPPTA
jgi:hypothetical protein